MSLFYFFEVLAKINYIRLFVDNSIADYRISIAIVAQPTFFYFKLSGTITVMSIQIFSCYRSH